MTGAAGKINAKISILVNSIILKYKGKCRLAVQLIVVPALAVPQLVNQVVKVKENQNVEMVQIVKDINLEFALSVMMTSNKDHSNRTQAFPLRNSLPLVDSLH